MQVCLNGKWYTAADHPRASCLQVECQHCGRVICYYYYGSVPVHLSDVCSHCKGKYS